MTSTMLFVPGQSKGLYKMIKIYTKNKHEVELNTVFMLVNHSTFGCYTVLTRANQLETAVHGCMFHFGLVSIMSLSC